MSNEGDPTLWRQVVEWMWAPLGAMIGVVWNMLHKRIDGLEAKLESGDHANSDEIDRQRDNIAKLFDKLEQHSQRAEDRHRELLTALHVGLAGKVDR